MTPFHETSRSRKASTNFICSMASLGGSFSEFDPLHLIQESAVSLADSSSSLQLSLYASKLTLSNCKTGAVNDIIHLDDVVGVKVDQKQLRGTNSALINRLRIISYPMGSGLKLPGQKYHRRRSECCLRFPLSDSSNVCEEWRDSILRALQAYLLHSYEYYDCTGPCPDIFLDRRTLLVVINPAADRGAAPRVFREEVAPVLRDAGISTVCVQTRYQGHARELLQAYNLSLVQGVLCVGGDGTVHEVINGLMKRADWEVAIHMPVCPIPCGAGNALCKTVLEESNEPFSVLSATLLAVHGAYIPLDLATGQFTNYTVYFFLSFSWGIIADTDIESERWKSLGNSRFTLAALKCILSNRVYEGTLHYLELSSEYSVLRESTAVTSSLLLRSIDRSSLPHSVGPLFPQNSIVPPLRSRQLPLSPLSPTTLMLPPLDRRIDSLGWECMEGSFVVLTAMLLPYLTKNVLFAPRQPIGSGCFELCTLRDRRSRLELIRGLSGVETGRHNDDMELVRAEAIRVESAVREGIFSIDGERFAVEPFQAQVLKQVGRVMCRRSRQRATAMSQVLYGTI